MSAKVICAFATLFVVATIVSGEANERMMGWNDQGRSSRQAGGRNNGGGASGADGTMEQQGRQQGQRSNNNGQYRTNLFNDDDVYGYEANYPGGEARYISYKNSDARARRGPEFARSSRYSSQGGDSNSRSARSQMREPSMARYQNDMN